MKRQSRPKPSQPPKAAGHNSLRIIGGQWRGRKLSFAELDGLRPTGDRIRETLFNWLMPTIHGARCLDLFSGSGALGFEALSRGAAEVVMLDREPRVAARLRQHVQTLDAQGAQVSQTDATQWLANPGPQSAFDIVFVDPPFALDLWQPVISALEAGPLLAEHALIYIESDRQTPLATPPQWALLKEKHSGQVSYRLFQRQV